jgi:type II secretory pathway component PulC
MNHLSLGILVFGSLIAASALADVDSALQNVRAVPVMENGQPAGYEIVHCEDSTTCQALNLKNGDKVQGVSGQPEVDPQHAMKIVNELEDSNSDSGLAGDQ